MVDLNGGANRLIGRDRELAALDVVPRRRCVGGATLLLAGEPGVGKTALLLAAAEMAATDGVRVIHGGGVEYESDISFAGLHQLVDPLSDDLRRLPPDQSRGARGGARHRFRPGTGPPRGVERIAGAVPPGGVEQPAAHRRRRPALAGSCERCRGRVRRSAAAGQPDRAPRCDPAWCRRILRARRIAGVRHRATRRARRRWSC